MNQLETENLDLEGKTHKVRFVYFTDFPGEIFSNFTRMIIFRARGGESVQCTYTARTPVLLADCTVYVHSAHTGIFS